MIKDSKIFITGGAGFLGRNLISRFYRDNQITVYSRDESKHYYLKKQYPNVNFIVGDIRNYDLLARASKGHDLGIFAASLKQIEACYDNYEEANKVIVEGAFNSRRIAEENNFSSACFISSDKSRSATTIYGAMKYVAGESFIANPQTSTNLNTLVYGNVANSTGSVIPLIWKSLEDKFPLTLYGKEMTRFIMTVEDAMNLIENSFSFNGYNIMPSAVSIKIKDLFELFHEEFGLDYSISSPRSGEKIHEIMANDEEVRRITYDKEKQIYLMHPTKVFNSVNFPNDEYSSRDFCMTKKELKEFLTKHNWFKS